MIDSLIQDSLSNEILKQINTQEFVKKIVPKIKEEIENQLLDSLNQLDWSDYISDLMYDAEIKDLMTEQFKNLILQGLK
jgi:hypothetical protein